MARTIRKVAVLGAGVMGSGIAAHLANTGTRCLLLDIVPPNLSEEDRKDRKKRNGFAAKGLENALKAKPAAFFHSRFAALVEVGNFEDDFARIGECDWVVEVVVERLDIKRKVFQQVAQHRKPGCIVTSNTSGLPISQMVEGFDLEFRQHFMVTHFFNPVRYMKLLELVAGPDTLPEVVQLFADFGQNVLGKGIVYGKDTPNFVANRIGVHGMMVAIDEMMKGGLTLEEVDAVLGTPMGRPKSAAFRTGDLVGVDTFVHVAKGTYDNCPKDEERDVFQPPAWLQKMVERGLLGDKTKGGFYKKEKSAAGKQVFQLDWKSETLDYIPVEKPKFKSVGLAKGIDDVAKRIRKVVESDDKVATYAWKVAARSLLYSANRLGEIADDIVNIDNGMKWGFNWDMGPFEAWDAIGVRESVARMEAEGMTIPKVVKKVLATPYGTWYIEVAGERYYFDPKQNRYRPVPKDPKHLDIASLKAKDRVVKKNGSASIVDIGDDVLQVEFHCKMNAIDDGIIEMLEKAVELAEANYKGIVLGNTGQNFSVGANLMLILMMAQQKNFAPIEEMVRRLQYANKAMRYCKRPVVAAPHQMALGGGCEMCLPADVIVAHAELYMGLVELGVGVIPAGGGCTSLVMRALDGVPGDMQLDRFPFIRRVFETIGMAKVSFSAELARELGFLRKHDIVVTNRDAQFQRAKEVVLGLYQAGYEPPREPDNLVMPGRTGLGALTAGLYGMRLSEYITPYDQVVAGKLAYILCGGDVPENTKVTEDRLLELEREVFMSLCGEKRTQDRMEHMLTKNKPLRN